jgi:hypothetical protein
MEWMPILSKVVEAVLVAILPPLAVALIAWLIGLAKKAWAEFKLINPTVADYLEYAARFAVEAAEQAGAAKLIEDKKEYAIRIAEVWLAEYHVTIDIDLIDAAIEKAVREMKHPETAPQIGDVKQVKATRNLAG